MKAFPLIVLLLSSLLWTPSATARTWTDSTGVFSLEAELVEVTDGKVRLKKADGKIVSLALDRLSEADREFLNSRKKSSADGDSADMPTTVSPKRLAKKPKQLALDDGKSADKRSIAGGGHAVRFESPGEDWYLTAVGLYGSRYGYPTPPKEDFHVWLCDEEFKVISDFTFPYSLFTRGQPSWVEMPVKPTHLPAKFIICVGFNPERTKGVYVHYDAESSGNSLVGLPDGRTSPFEQGDWLIRAMAKQLKGGRSR